MTPFIGNLEKLTIANSFFRQVISTSQYNQLVLMCLKPGEEIGSEVHDHVDQFFRFEQGTGQVIIDSQTYSVTDGDAVIIPAGSRHNIINVGQKDLKLYTLYSPPNHPDHTVHKTKSESDVAETAAHL